MGEEGDTNKQNHRQVIMVGATAVVSSLLTAIALSLTGFGPQNRFLVDEPKTALVETEIRFYEPFDSSGMAPAVYGDNDTGSCTGESFGSPRLDAIRCFSDETHYVLDPCFMSVSLDGAPVVCPLSGPWANRSVILTSFRRDPPFDRPYLDAKSPATIADLGGDSAIWGVELEGGVRCTRVVGGTHSTRATFDPLFDCEDGGGIAGALTRRQELLLANYFSEGSTSGKRLAIRTAWF